MKVLTKKYRIVWNGQNEMLNNPYQDYMGTKTTVGQGRSSFETYDVSEIEEKINELGLKGKKINRK